MSISSPPPVPPPAIVVHWLVLSLPKPAAVTNFPPEANVIVCASKASEAIVELTIALAANADVEIAGA